MSALIVLAVIVVAGWAYSLRNTVLAAEPTEVDVRRSRQDVITVVTAEFGRTWGQVQGPGLLNVRPLLRKAAFTLSVDVDETGPEQCRVSIWVSSSRRFFLVMNHAQLAKRRKARLAAVLGAAAPEERGDRHPSAA